MLGDGQYKWQLNQISLKIKELKVHCQQVLLQKKIEYLLINYSTTKQLNG